VVGLLTGRAEPLVIVWDLVAFLALLIAVRWSWLGVVAVAVVSVVGLAVDVTGLGFSSYIGACAVAVWVRRGEFWRAGVVTLVSAACMGTLMARRADAEVVSAIVGPGAIFLVAWLIGLGFRWVARVEAERVSKEYTERQMRMAVDIHDFVGRNLTGVLVRADGATAEQRADPAFLDELVHRVRTADATLREVTADLQREGSAQPFRAVGAVDALRVGVAELAAAGVEVEQNPEAAVLLAGLPPEVDLVASRIVADTLHNVLKHADPARPCRVEATRDGDILTVVVTNGVKHRPGRANRSLGLVGMRRHAALAGGTAVSQAEGDVWTCRVTIPINREGLPT
jgi:signal transduction histidine kinase